VQTAAARAPDTPHRRFVAESTWLSWC